MNNEQMLMQALAPKSDQLNADDLIVANKVIKFTKVLVNLQSEAQKVIVHYENDQGKPWKPSKSMGRVLAEILGADFAAWEGQQIELFKNKEITFGKEKCGGIQIAAMGALKNAVTVMITTKRAVKSKITILPLLVAPEQSKKSNPALREIATALQKASALGVAALNAEAALIPEQFRSEMIDWLAKCMNNAKAVDAAKLQQEPEQAVGFNPHTQNGIIDNAPPASDEMEPQQSMNIQDM